MIKYNLKLIFRSLWVNRLYASIILLSLTIGFICANLLTATLVAETSADSFHKNKDRIFQLSSNDPFGGTGQVAFVPRSFFDYASSNFPEVADICQVAAMDGLTLETSKNKISDMLVLAADTSFFQLFDFPLEHQKAGSLLDKGHIVLSKEKAESLFGHSNVVGEELTLRSSDTTFQLQVSAISEKPLEKSHLVYDAVLSHSHFPKNLNGGATYVLMENGDLVQTLLSKVNNDPLRPTIVGPGKVQYHLSPLKESYFNTDNKMRFMKTRSPLFITIGYVVCALVLFIATFNFVNLFLLFWQKRKKEVGIKKTLGLTLQNLFAFSIVEAAVYIVITYLVSLAATMYLLPIFNSIFEADLSAKYFISFKLISILGFILLIFCGLIVTLSVVKQWQMKPINLMSQGSTRTSFSKLLFTIQFVISITLVVCSATIIRQMNFLEKAPLGFNRHIIQLNSPSEEKKKDLTILKQKLNLIPEIKNSTVCSGNPISGNMILRYDLANEEFYTPYLFSGDEDFLKTLNLKVILGSSHTSDSKGKLVNEKLVRQFQMADPIGQRIPGTEDIIIGVVQDFTCGSFKTEIPPVIISYQEEGQAMLLDVSGKTLEQTLPKIQITWQEVFPDYPFAHRIIQEDLMKKYKDDTFFYRIVLTFSMVSMVLSCFGLFALSWAVIQNRTKEMGIRKVLGATSLDILNLLTMPFTKRIAIAFIFASPFAYYLSMQWLSRFAYRVDIDAWIFVFTAGVVFLVALATLGAQTLKASMANPVEEIRRE